MGFKIKIKAPKIKISPPKTGIKAIDNTVKAAVAVTNGINTGLSKVADGKISEGIGDIGQTGARMGLDIATGGNKSTVDALTGGTLSMAELAARGNTGDASKLAITGAAAYAGGPQAAMTTNALIQQNGLTTSSLAQSGYSTLLGSNAMNIGNILGDIQNSTGFNAAQTLSSLLGIKNDPSTASGVSVVPQQPQVIAMPSMGGDNSKLLLFGGLGIAALLVGFLVIKKS